MRFDALSRLSTIKCKSSRNLGLGIVHDKVLFRVGNINFPDFPRLLRACSFCYAKELNVIEHIKGERDWSSRMIDRRLMYAKGTIMARDEWSLSLSLSLLLDMLKDCITGKMACLIRPFIRRATADTAVKSEGAFVNLETSTGLPIVSARTRVFYICTVYTTLYIAHVQCNYNKLVMLI